MLRFVCVCEWLVIIVFHGVFRVGIVCAQLVPSRLFLCTWRSFGSCVVDLV